ncbi:MAG TPA: hypothetical protein VN281_04360 [Verrucomicrobiae bacterium]|jgi:hypothetical protein|nr:hypothetical protein [Verrucomicrobiae bacterium]
MKSEYSDIQNAGTRVLPEGYVYVSHPQNDPHENFLRIRDQALWQRLYASRERSAPASGAETSIISTANEEQKMDTHKRRLCSECGREILLNAAGGFRRHNRLSGVLCVASAQAPSSPLPAPALP